MAIGAPEVEGKQGRTDRKTHEHHGERPHLEIHGKGDLRNLQQVPTARTAFEVEPEQGGKNHVHAVHAGGKQLYQREEHLLVPLDVPADQSACPHDYRGEQQQEDAQAVGTYNVVGVEGVHPRNIGKEPQWKRCCRRICRGATKGVYAVHQVAYRKEHQGNRGQVDVL